MFVFCLILACLAFVRALWCSYEWRKQPKNPIEPAFWLASALILIFMAIHA